MSVGAVYVELCGQWEADRVFLRAERRNLLRTARFLLAELIARYTDHAEASRLESFVYALQSFVLGSQPAVGSDIDDERRAARELGKVEHLAVQSLHLEVVDTHAGNENAASRLCIPSEIERSETQCGLELELSLLDPVPEQFLSTTDAIGDSILMHAKACCCVLEAPVLFQEDP